MTGARGTLDRSTARPAAARRGGPALTEVPVIDVAPLEGEPRERRRVAADIDAACREHGFFCIVGHGVDPLLVERLERSAREFFALTASEKADIAMARGGRAWRGWFPVGGELTSGAADGKEGLYFGAELGLDDPRVRAGIPLHGPNLFPARPAELRDGVLQYMSALTRLGHRLMRAFASGLGLGEEWFAREMTADPVVLFRIFHYPAATAHGPGPWGVGEHTDYGFLTMLLQDETGGLEVRGPNGWIEVPPRRDALVCNLGDMLERITGGRYRSTPHRVRVPEARGRIACPFFFDPSWDARMRALPLGGAPDSVAVAGRWDGANPHEFTGTYGDYLLAKVAKVFPELRDAVALTDGSPSRER